MSPDLSRIIASTVVDANGCWIWQEGTNKGYGVKYMHGRTHRVHRWVFQQVHGPISDDVMVCHRCDVRACCNPAHLYAGDASTNIQDTLQRSASTTALWAIHRAKTHCPRGHAYDEANTDTRNGRGRRCRACRRQTEHTDTTPGRAAAIGGVEWLNARRPRFGDLIERAAGRGRSVSFVFRRGGAK